MGPVADIISVFFDPNFQKHVIIAFATRLCSEAGEAIRKREDKSELSKT